MQRLGLWLVTACLIGAGCIGAVAQGTPAMEHRSTADEQARDVYPEADLISVNSFEGNASIEPEWDEHRDDPRTDNREEEELDHRWGYPVQDEEIGDGAPPAWVYEYRLDNATYVVIVAENGTVISQERDDDAEEEAHPIEDWEVTSIEAVEIIQDNNATWAVDGDGMAFYSLEPENATGDPVWTMGRIDESGIVVARVNATTGEFLGAHPVTFDFDWSWNGNWSGGGWGSGWSGWDDDGRESPEREGGSFSDSVSATDDTNEHTFELDHDGHPELGARLALEDPATGTVQATIIGPEGEEIDTLEASPGQTDVTGKWSRAIEGDHQATVELADGVDQGYTFDWCADGHDSGDQETEEACGRVMAASPDGVVLEPQPIPRALP